MRKLLLLLMATAGAVAIATGANVVSASDENQSELEFVADTAIVKLDGYPLFQVRGMAGRPASERAKAIAARIKGVAANRSVPASSISIVALADRSHLMAGNTMLVVLLDADAAIENLPRTLMAEQVRLNVIQALEKYRNDRSKRVLLRRTALTVGLTAMVFLLLIGIRRLFLLLLTVAERHLKARMESLENRSSHVADSRPLWVAVVGMFNALRFVITAVIVYFYLNMVLGLYPWTRSIATELFAIFVEPFKVLGTKFIEIIPDLAFLVILWFVTRYILKVIRLFFAGIDRGTLVFNNFEQDWAWPTYRIVRLLVICFAVVVAYPYIPGSNSGAFKGVSLFVGVLFSLGSTSFIANMVAGLALTYRRAFRVGDLIKMDDAMGVVTDMRLQATHVRTIKNESVVIPNSELVSRHVINYSTLSKGTGLILHTRVGIGYETPWRQVEAMLIMAAKRTPGLMKEREPFVLQKNLGEFFIDYEVNAYCDTPLTMMAVYSDLHKNILDVFNEYGVQIMTPAYEGDPEKPKVVPKDELHKAPAKNEVIKT